MTFRDAVLEAIKTEADDAGYDEIVGYRVPHRLLRVHRWSGPRPYSLPDDCRKERSLLVDAAGRMSCLEVDVVRLLRDHWQAGWVQGFGCGWRSWSSAIWKAPPAAVGSINERVQAARGQRRTSTHSGHPDVAVTDGVRVACIECKMDDDLKPGQIDWLTNGLRHGIVTVDQLLVIQGVDR